MYLSNSLINILCKYNVSFTVKYKATDTGSFIELIKIDDINKNIIIKPLGHIGYILEVDDNLIETDKYETLCVHLVSNGVLPADAWF